VQPGGTAIRYPIAVGREGLGMEGTFTVGRKAQWPGLDPHRQHDRPRARGLRPLSRRRARRPHLAPGRPRALLYRGGQDTYFRVHGTNDLSSIGNSGSAGCIRLFNHDIIDLYNRVPNGTGIIVRTYAESVRLEGQAMASRGIELPPFFTGEGQRPPVPEAMLPESQYRGNMAFLEAPLMGGFAEVMGMEMVGTGFAPRG
jgi:hypothetical protein